MKEKSLLLIIITFIFGCSKDNNDKDNFPYVVKHSASQPPDIYGTYNFIVLDSTIFYFRIEPSRYMECGTGHDGRPKRLFLTHDSLKQVAANELSGFLMKTYAEDISGDEYRTSVSSPTDTIQNPTFKILISFFKEKNIRFVNIRNWTEEEQYVTISKVKNLRYTPDLIKWKIGFDTSYTSNDLKRAEN